MKIRKIVLPEKYKVKIEYTELPPLAANEFVIKNDYSMISPGTELAFYTGTHIGLKDPSVKWARYPFYPGYASVGKVVKIGNNVKELKAGDTILHFEAHSSHTALNTVSDLFLKLKRNTDTRLSLFSRFAQIAYTAWAFRHVQSGKVLVIGAGLIGNLAAQIFHLKGSETTIISDQLQNRLKIAKECGIPFTINTELHRIDEYINKITEGKGIDIVIEATGVPALAVKALELVNRMGEVILLGSTRGEVTINVYKLIHRKGTMLTGAHESRFPLRNTVNPSCSREHVTKDMVGLIAEGKIQTQPLVTHQFKPGNIRDAYEGLLLNPADYLGVLINWKEDNL